MTTAYKNYKSYKAAARATVQQRLTDLTEAGAL